MKLELINKKEIAPGVWDMGFDIKNQNFSFKAGQYIRLVLPRLDIDDTKGPARLFSISSSPNDKEQLDIIFRVSESGYKRTLLNMPIGSEAEFEGPWGSFVLPGNAEKPVMFIAGGTGITPFLSMIRFATEEKISHRITLLYASRNKNNTIYLPELKELARRNSKLRINFVNGRIDEKLIRKNSPKNLDAVFYISGPPGMVDYVRGILEGAKAPQESIYYEEWSNIDFLRPQIKNMFNVSTDAIFLTDLAGIIKYVNPMWEKLSGWKAEDVVEKCTPRIQKSGEQSAEFYKELWNYHINGKAYKHDVVNKRKDGTLYEIDHLYLPLLSAAKEIVGFVAFQREISEEKIKENELSKAILMSIGEGLAVFDKNMETTMVNRAAQSILGWSEKELIGKVWPEFVGVGTEKVDNLPAEQSPLAEAIKGRTIVSTLTGSTVYYYRKKDKTRIPVSIVATPLLSRGEIIGAIVVFRDITREKEVDQAKTEFISIASHQLKTPLTAISWVVERLTSGKVGKFTKKQKDYLADIYDSNKRMVRLVDDLLSVSRLEEGKIRIEAKPLQLEELIEKAIKDNGFLITKRGCRIVFDKPEEKFSPILLDESLARQIMGNLLTNAIRYSRNGCNVGIRLEKREKSFLLSVADQGIGIPKDKQGSVFGKFFRADNARKAHPDGTGLGLYITKMMVGMLGGKIWFDSEEGVGTNFYVELPLEATGLK